MKVDKAFFTSPESQAMCRETSRAIFHHFDSAAEARQISRQYSNHVLSLDGEWDFTYTESPEQIDEKFQDNPNLNWEKVNVPDCWVMRESVPDNPHYTNHKMPFAAQSPEVPEKNPTGIYRREFQISSFAANELSQKKNTQNAVRHKVVFLWGGTDKWRKFNDFFKPVFMQIFCHEF